MIRRGIYLVGLGLLVGFQPGTMTTVQAVVRLEPSNVMLAADVVATGLDDPAGMAIDPLTGDLVVAERGADRITRIHKKDTSPAMPEEFEIDTVLPAWAVGLGRSVEFWTDAELRSPVDLCFDADGALLVAESGEGGRLLKFSSDEGLYKKGTVVSTPWLHGDYAYSGITMDDHGRIYLTARQSRRDTVLPSGSALVREANGEWWMIDYGPFSDFAPPVVDREGEFIILADRQNADVCWYDQPEQVHIGVMEQLFGMRHVAITDQGVTLATLEREDGTWSVIELDPKEPVLQEWIGGLSTIGGMYVNPATDEIFLSLSEEGKVMRLQEMEPVRLPHSRLQVMRADFRRERELPPPEWPSFFKSFVEQLGVIEPINERKHAKDGIRKSLTLPEFTEALPVIAGKAKARLLTDDVKVEDPIEEIGFVLFHPNQSMASEGTLAPSLSLFYAQHQSGATKVTRFMPTRFGQEVSSDMSWEQAPLAFVSFPSGFRAKQSPLSENGLVRVYFLGMGFGPDYHVDIRQAREDAGELKVEMRNGDKVRYELETFEEPIVAGGSSVLVANNVVKSPGWYAVADYPVVWNIVVDEPASLNLRHSFSMQDFLAHDVQLGGGQVAEAFEKTTDREDLRWRRQVILQAAARWKNLHF